MGKAMRALKLDYRRKNGWPLRAGWALLLLACLALADQGWQYRQLSRGIEAGQAELARLRGQLQPQASHDSGAGKSLQEELGYARTVLLQLDVPWVELFEAVEASVNTEVALLGIEPEPKQETVQIIGEAKDYPAVTDYIRRLEESAPLSGVYLQTHQIRTEDSERPVYFVLGATWRGRQ